jgi:hypothetical protein
LNSAIGLDIPNSVFSSKKTSGRSSSLASGRTDLGAEASS